MWKILKQYSVSIGPVSKGFTMLEMLVSVAIFSVVAIVAVGSLVRIAGLNRQARSLQDAMTSVSYALESMSREIRMGTTYHCFENANTEVPSDFVANLCFGRPVDDGRIIAFKSSKSSIVGLGAPCRLVYAYRFIKDGVGYKLQKGEQTECGDSILPAEFYDIISGSDIILTGYELAVETREKGYSFVNLGMGGYAGAREKERHYFDIYTGVSQRIAD